jgi:hypothetical protein
MNDSNFTTVLDGLANSIVPRNALAVLLTAAQATAREFFRGHNQAAIMALVDM